MCYINKSMFYWQVWSSDLSSGALLCRVKLLRMRPLDSMVTGLCSFVGWNKNNIIFDNNYKQIIKKMNSIKFYFYINWELNRAWKIKINKKISSYKITFVTNYKLVSKIDWNQDILLFHLKFLNNSNI